jgi:hypothetical protein
MERLSFDTLKKLGYEGYLLENAPEKISSSARATSCALLQTISST